MARAALIAAVATILTTGAGAAMQQHVFAGRWVANIERSRLDPKFAFKSAHLEISVTDDRVTLSSTMVGPDGAEQKGTETLVADGRETKGTLTPGVMHVANWVGLYVLAFTASRDNRNFALMTYEVSPDGKTLTARSSGMLEQVVVFEKVFEKK